MIELATNRLSGMVDKAKNAARSTSIAKMVEEHKYEKLHNQTTGLIANVGILESLVEQNIQSLTEKSNTDVNAKKLLDIVQTGRLDASSETILDRKALSSEDAAQFIVDLEDLVSAINNIEGEFTVSIKDIIDTQAKVINDDRFTETDRKDQLENLLTTLEALDTSDDALIEETRKLRSLQESSDALTDDRLVAINKSLALLRNSTQDVKLNQTLNDMNKSLDLSIMTQDQLASTLTRDNLKNELQDNSSAVSQGASGMTRGLTSWALGSMGLGGIDALLGDVISDKITDKVGDLAGGVTDKLRNKAGGVADGFRDRFKGRGGKFGKLVGGLASKVLPSAAGAATTAASVGAGVSGLSTAAAGTASAAAGGGFLSKAGGVVSKMGGKALAKGALKFLGPLGLALSAGSDAIDGFSNADSIAGKDSKDLTLGDKIQSGASSILSGLTFGMLDSGDIYKQMDKVFDMTPENERKEVENSDKENAEEKPKDTRTVIPDHVTNDQTEVYETLKGASLINTTSDGVTTNIATDNGNMQSSAIAYEAASKALELDREIRRAKTFTMGKSDKEIAETVARLEKERSTVLSKDLDSQVVRVSAKDVQVVPESRGKVKSSKSEPIEASAVLTKEAVNQLDNSSSSSNTELSNAITSLSSSVTKPNNVVVLPNVTSVGSVGSVGALGSVLGSVSAPPARVVNTKAAPQEGSHAARTAQSQSTPKAAAPRPAPRPASKPSSSASAGPKLRPDDTNLTLMNSLLLDK